jgi:hypothetical protein
MSSTLLAYNSIQVSPIFDTHQLKNTHKTRCGNFTSRAVMWTACIGVGHLGNNLVHEHQEGFVEHPIRELSDVDTLSREDNLPNS